MKDYVTLMEDLVERLNLWQDAYDNGKPIVSDLEFDLAYFELKELEKKYDYSLPNSPTIAIKFPVVSELLKVKHNHPMLSLDKTKEVDEIKTFIKKNPCITMLKMDGLTMSLTYTDGLLTNAETRGDGIIGENVLHNAIMIENVPKRIPMTEGVLTVDGEVICTYEDFEKIQETTDYKNPRNYASGSLRLLDPKQSASRKLKFVAWDSEIEMDTLSEKLDYLSAFFTVVPYAKVYNVDNTIEELKTKADELSYPIDGLVFKYNNCEYYDSCGRTDHHFKGGLALKFYDDLYETRLRTIHYSLGRTGVLTPVAVFDPVEIDGTTVERANLHNYSVMEEVLGTAYVGQRLKIYKANQIIPQVAEAEKLDYGYIVSHCGVTCDGLSGDLLCPVCQGGTKFVESNGITNIYCDNPDCSGKLINKLDHLCGKKGLDIKGVSKKTIEQLMNEGWLNKLSDIFTLKEHKNEWKKLDGWGEKSVSKIINAIEEGQNNQLWRLISSAGIYMIGTTQSKILADKFKSWSNFREAVDNGFDFTTIDGFGYSMDTRLHRYDYTEIDEVRKYLCLAEVTDKEDAAPASTSLDGMTIVITGKLKSGTRDQIKEKIELAGGKVTGSISKKTNVLINNDTTSTTAKNKKAMELGIPIISEDDFFKMYLS
jgi:DNA ligase (NAD+)